MPLKKCTNSSALTQRRSRSLKLPLRTSPGWSGPGLISARATVPLRLLLVWVGPWLMTRLGADGGSAGWMVQSCRQSHPPSLAPLDLRASSSSSGLFRYVNGGHAPFAGFCFRECRPPQIASLLSNELTTVTFSGGGLPLMLHCTICRRLITTNEEHYVSSIRHHHQEHLLHV